MFLCRFEKALIQYLSNLAIQIYLARLGIAVQPGSIKVMRKPALCHNANNKGADPRSLISAFSVFHLDSTILV